MSYRASAPTYIHDSNFTDAQNVYHLNSSTYHLHNVANPNTQDPDPFERLKKHAALDASYDSEARFDPPKCHPETRIAILRHIRQWAKDSDSLPMLWLRGPAGAGKSAIAQTLSEGWDEDGTLAASFYFSRTAAGRNEKRRFVATLAYQIAITLPAARPLIEDAIRKDPEVFDRILRAQIKKLIVDPLVSLKRTSDGLGKAWLVVVDGLDECCIDYERQDHEQQQKEILEALRATFEHPDFPLRFLVASRPEREIRDIFNHGVLSTVSHRIVLDDTHNPAADVELYLRRKLQEIQEKHPHLRPSWPGEDIIAQLVAKSSGHFIYAAVVIRFLSTPRMDPETGLRAVLQAKAHGNKNNPLAELDAVYTYILQSVAADSLPIVMGTLWILIMDAHDNLFEARASVRTPVLAAEYFFISLGQLYLHLTDLHSILDIPPIDYAANARISFFHASFSEFLLDKSRSENFCLHNDNIKRDHLQLCLKHVFVQVLSPDSGDSNHYSDYGFAVEFAQTLKEYGLRSAEPDTEILDSTRALLSKDESEFTQYVYRAKLDEHGTTRRSLGAIQALCRYRDWEWQKVSTSLKLPFVLQVLKKYPKEGFRPLNPTVWNPAWGSADQFEREWNSNASLLRPEVDEHYEEDPVRSPVRKASETAVVATTSGTGQPTRQGRQGFGSRIVDLLC